MSKKRKYKYDYYTIDLDSGAFDSDEEIRLSAIQEARERVRLYIMPCEWRAEIIAGGLDCFITRVKVCRIRYR